MSTPKPYHSETEAPARDEVDILSGLTLLEFGTDTSQALDDQVQPFVNGSIAGVQFPRIFCQ